MAALDDALLLLRCPVCGAGLARAGAAVVCAAGHSFDVARQGYLSLPAGGRPSPAGDTAAMVAARERFLDAGHFEPLAAAVAERAAGARVVVELGAGPARYLARAVGEAALGIALDVSKPALRRAARAHPRVAAVGCDVWRPLPLADACVDVVLDVFAPRNAAEIARVLAPSGRAVVVTPAPGHLAELVGSLGLLSVDSRKDERLAEQLEPDLTVVERTELTWPLSLDAAAARDAVAMGPSAFHVAPAELEARLAALPQPVEATAAVSVSVVRPSQSRGAECSASSSSSSRLRGSPPP